jgi:hypothetical protein
MSAKAKAKRNVNAAAAAKVSAAAEAKRSEKRALFFDRCVGAVDSFEMAVSLFVEYEKAAEEAEVAAAAAEEDAKLATLCYLFERSHRTAAKAEVEAGAALAHSSGAVCALFVRAERAFVAS